MTDLVERLIASRDRLKGFAVPSDDDIMDARQVMADAANGLSELHTLLDRLNEHVRPTNWDDEDDPEQVAVWKALDKLVEARR